MISKENSSKLFGITYLGKRGSFFQLLDSPRQVVQLPEGFLILKGIISGSSEISSPEITSFPLGIIQAMDDWGPDLTFKKIDVYSDKKISLGKDRTRDYVMLPYRLIRSSRGFSYYETIQHSAELPTSEVVS